MFFLLFAIEMTDLSVFLQKKGLGRLGAKQLRRTATSSDRI